MASAHERQRIAHVLRRCGFGPVPGEVERWEEQGAAALIDDLLANTEVRANPADSPLADLDLESGEYDDDDYQLFVSMAMRMLRAMGEGDNQLHERMVWFWHTHFTSSYEKGSARGMWTQHHLVRRNALGNFADLAREITTDAAMLFYLDGAESRGEAPNENYAREFLELFTLGRDGGYTEEDVRGAARILAGWNVDWETREVSFDPEQGFDRPVTFMGDRRRWTLDDFVAAVCAKPACARHVSAQIYHHLVGPDLSDARNDELAAVFADSGLDITAVIAEILRGPDFLESVNGRPRQPIEWFVGMHHALGLDLADLEESDMWRLENLGQVPFYPPNVGGWPLDDRWAAADQVIARTSILFDRDLPDETIDNVTPTADAVLARCGVYEPSATTLAALKQIEADVSEYDRRLELLFATVLVSPEFTLL